MLHQQFGKATTGVLITSLLLIAALIGVISAGEPVFAQAAVGPEPTWAFPFPTGTSVSIGPKGIHGDNFKSIQDDRTGTVYKFTNPKDPDSLDLLLEPEVKGTASIAVTPLASGTVLAVWAECHVVLIDYGSGWWAIYLHLTNIQVTSGTSVAVNTIIGYPTTKIKENSKCGNEQSSTEHVHFAFLNGSGTTGTYVSMLGRTLCGHAVVEQNGHPKNIILQGLTQTKDQVFTIPSCLQGWSLTGNVALGREHFQATTLPNGLVLIEGGFTSSGTPLSESELYNPMTGTWTVTGSLNQPRGQQSATLLQNGLVLVAAGFGPPLNSAELYNPATGMWTYTGSMSEVRTRDTETLLQNGEVLAAGGWNGGVTSGAELYNPTTGSWSSAGNMTSPRTNHIAVLLPNGKVLVAGGEPVDGGFPHTATAELYDPVTNTWTPTGSLNIGRSLFTGVLLPNGKVLVAGGCTDTGGTATAELYDPNTGMWTMTGSMQRAGCLDQGQHAILLPSGKVLIVGEMVLVLPQARSMTQLLDNGDHSPIS